MLAYGAIISFVDVIRVVDEAVTAMCKSSITHLDRVISNGERQDDKHKVAVAGIIRREKTAYSIHRHNSA